MVITFRPALRAKDSRLKNLRFPKVSNLKMDIDETENPFGDEVGNRGVDDDDENIPLISTSSRAVQKTQIIAPTTELAEKHLLLKE